LRQTIRPNARTPEQELRGFLFAQNQIMIRFIESDHDLIFCLSMIFFRKTGSHFSGSCSKDAIASAEDRNRVAAVRSAECRFLLCWDRSSIAPLCSASPSPGTE